MKAKPLPTQEELRQLFMLDEATGVLVRRHNPNIPDRMNKRCAGKPTGCPNTRGYLQVGIGQELFLAHRIIWKMVHGTEPERIDHRDMNPNNNRPDNLRAADHSQNLCNRARVKNKELPKGVFKKRNKFLAKITTRGITTYLGTFSTVEEAAAAYAAAAKVLHGEFGRAG